MIVKFHKCRNKKHPFPLFAWLIMIFQGMLPWSKKAYSHMAIELNGVFIDCRFTGCHKSTDKEFKDIYKIVDTIKLNLLIDKADYFRFFKKYEHVKYDFLQIFGLLLKFVKLLKVNTIGKDAKKIICSELIILFLSNYKDFKYEDSDNFGLNDTWCILEGYKK